MLKKILRGEQNMWIIFALLSAVFAALTSILAKIGIENVNSNLRVITNYDKTRCSFEGLDIMENTIKYLDNILRNPNRFIINEEDIVKVELARRVTVESIKHLSRNTNLIQDIDKKTGDVKPSKILNINKEESFNTYENRFIYSLIKNMQFFIKQRKRQLKIIIITIIKIAQKRAF